MCDRHLVHSSRVGDFGGPFALALVDAGPWPLLVGAKALDLGSTRPKIKERSV